MPNWTESGVTKDLQETSKKVMEATKEKYNDLVKKCASDMGIDMKTASAAEKKKLFNKVDQMWNSDDEKGKDGEIEEKTCEPFDKKPMEEEIECDKEDHSDCDHEDMKEETEEASEEVIEEDLDLETFNEEELDALEAKAEELGLKKNLEETEQLDELLRSPEDKIKLKNMAFWNDMQKAEKDLNKVMQILQKSSRKNFDRHQQRTVDDSMRDLNLVWYNLKDIVQNQLKD